MMRSFFAVILASVIAACGAAPDTTAGPSAGAGAGEVQPHAELLVFIMARCPHCAVVLKALLPVKRELGDALDMGIGYVGTVDRDGLADFAHGDAEVAAAEIQICVALQSEKEAWVDFLSCQYEGEGWRDMPRGWTKCAERAGVDIEDVTRCVDEGDGHDALGQAISAAAMSGIEAAPTLILDGRMFLGGRTREDLLVNICYGAGKPETRPAVCDEVDEPPEVTATLVADSRCEDPLLCDVSRELAFLEVLIPTLSVEMLDFGSEEGRRIYELVREHGGPRHLPYLVIDRALAQHRSARERMDEYLIELEQVGFVMTLGEGWDPLAEICDNRIDDTGDGLVDCDDATCATTLLCREEVGGHLDLFIMSQCPFATSIVPSVDRFLEHFDRDRKQVDLVLQFIGRGEDGKLASMHGDEELAEDLRMICAQELYPKKYAFMEYVSCRAADYTSVDWEPCVPKGMSISRIRDCAQGERGRELLAKSFALADQVGAAGSPSFVLNNNTEVDARSAAEITRVFCERNDRPACKREVASEPETDLPPEQCE